VVGNPAVFEENGIMNVPLTINSHVLVMISKGKLGQYYTKSGPTQTCREALMYLNDEGYITLKDNERSLYSANPADVGLTDKGKEFIKEAEHLFEAYKFLTKFEGE
jgi:hypothetical protein